MKNVRPTLMLVCCLMITLLVCACAAPTVISAPDPTAGPVAEATAEPVAEPTAEPAAEPTAEPAAEPVAADPTAAPADASAALPAESDNALGFSASDLDMSWSQEDATLITFDGASSASIQGEGAAAVEDGVKISAGGVYVLSGVMTDGRVVVSLDSDEPLLIVLNGVDLTCTTSAPLYFSNGDAKLILADGTTNTLTDAATYQFADSAVQEPNACLYADDNLIIGGNGALIVKASFNNGIGSKDEMRIVSGDITVDAKNNALKGNDCVLIHSGTLHLTSGNDGIKSDTEKTPGMGVILIEDGSISITCADDALQATSRITVTGGQTAIAAGGKRLNCDGALEIAAGCLN